MAKGLSAVSLPIGAKLFLEGNFRAQAKKLFQDLAGFGDEAGKKASNSWRKRFGKQVGKGIGTAVTQIGSLVGGGFTAGLAATFDDVVEFERKVESLGTQGNLTGQKLDNVTAAIKTISKQTGVGRAAIADVANEIINLEGAAGFSTEKLDLLTKAQVATEAEARDLVAVQKALNDAFFDGKASMGEIGPMLDAVTEAGKQGSVPLEEMARVLRENATSFSMLSSQGQQGAAELASWLQVVATRFGSASQAGTSARAMLNDLLTKADKLRTYGVDPFRTMADGSKQLRPLTEIIADIEHSKLATRPDLMAKIFSQEGGRGIQATRKAADEWKALAAASQGANTISADFHRKNTSRMGTLRHALTDTKNAMMDAFTPDTMMGITHALAMLPVALNKLVEWLGKLAGYLEKLLGETPDRIAQNAATLPQQDIDRAVGLAEGRFTAGQEAGARARIQARGEVASASAIRAEQGKALLAGAAETGWIKDGQIDVVRIGQDVLRKQGFPEEDYRLQQRRSESTYTQFEETRRLVRGLQEAQAATASYQPRTERTAVEAAFTALATAFREEGRKTRAAIEGTALQRGAR